MDYRGGSQLMRIKAPDGNVEDIVSSSIQVCSCNTHRTDYHALESGRQVHLCYQTNSYVWN